MHSETMLRAASHVPDDVLAHFTMAGDAAVCLRRVAELEDQGVTQIGVLPWVVPGQTLEQFMTEFAGAVMGPYHRDHPGTRH